MAECPDLEKTATAGACRGWSKSARTAGAAARAAAQQQRAAAVRILQVRVSIGQIPPIQQVMSAAAKRFHWQTELSAVFCFVPIVSESLPGIFPVFESGRALNIAIESEKAACFLAFNRFDFDMEKT